MSNDDLEWNEQDPVWYHRGTDESTGHLAVVYDDTIMMIVNLENGSIFDVKDQTTHYPDLTGTIESDETA